MKNYIVQKANIDEFEICKSYDQLLPSNKLKEKLQEGYIFLLKDKDNIVGYLRWDLFWNRIPYICLIKLIENHRGQGLGKTLLNAFEQHARNINKSFIISSSQANEPRPQNWHKQEGFREIGILSTLNEDGSDEIFYRKEL